MDVDAATRQLVKNLRNDLRKGLATETRRERVMASLNKLYKHLTLQLNGTCGIADDSVVQCFVQFVDAVDAVETAPRDMIVKGLTCMELFVYTAVPLPLSLLSWITAGVSVCVSDIIQCHDAPSPGTTTSGALVAINRIAVNSYVGLVGGLARGGSTSGFPALTSDMCFQAVRAGVALSGLPGYSTLADRLDTMERIVKYWCSTTAIDRVSTRADPATVRGLAKELLRQVASNGRAAERSLVIPAVLVEFGYLPKDDDDPDIVELLSAVVTIVVSGALPTPLPPCVITLLRYLGDRAEEGPPRRLPPNTSGLLAALVDAVTAQFQPSRDVEHGNADVRLRMRECMQALRRLASAEALCEDVAPLVVCMLEATMLFCRRFAGRVTQVDDSLVAYVNLLMKLVLSVFTPLCLWANDPGEHSAEVRKLRDCTTLHVTARLMPKIFQIARSAPMFDDVRGVCDGATGIFGDVSNETVARNTATIAASQLRPRGLWHWCSNIDCDGRGVDADYAPKSRTSRCSVCRVARYCSVECQKHAWKTHKPVCALMKETMEAATAPALAPAPAPHFVVVGGDDQTREAIRRMFGEMNIVE